MNLLIFSQSLLKSLVVLALLQNVIASKDKPVVQTKLGKIEGHIIESYGGKTVKAFEGIPYAKPPLGILRFKDPQPVEPWSGAWKAKTIFECSHATFDVGTLVGSEDCLYLNVYVPMVANETSRLDVIVHIHGGAFMMGSTDLARPTYIMEREDVVYVNLNYRLGALGFMSTENGVVPGNQGLKDQVKALEWIKHHVQQFGGNPNSVTLTGLSAGGGAAHLHFFSKKSRGLFHRAVSHSGSALAPWVIQEGALEKAQKLGILVGCEDVDIEYMVACMQTRPVQQILQASMRLYSKIAGFPLALFGPVVEARGKHAFLEEYPYCALKRGDVYDVPWLTSISSHEGILGIMMFKENFDEIERVWNEGAQHMFVYNYTSRKEDRPIMARRIKKFYFGIQDVSNKTSKGVIDAFGDRYFVHSFEKAARMQAKASRSPVYAYRFGYRNSFVERFENMYGLYGDYGVNHGEDTQLLYGVNYQGFAMDSSNLTESDEYMKDLLLDIIVSFAKDGRPNVEGVSWKPVSVSKEFDFLEINGPDDIETISLNELAPTEFWDELPIMENKKIVKKVCQKS